MIKLRVKIYSPDDQNLQKEAYIKLNIEGYLLYLQFLHKHIAKHGLKNHIP